MFTLDGQATDYAYLTRSTDSHLIHLLRNNLSSNASSVMLLSDKASNSKTKSARQLQCEFATCNIRVFDILCR
jgi:DNA polymerase III sliding clamp (beta) subunit (PCNA family)